METIRNYLENFTFQESNYDNTLFHDLFMENDQKTKIEYYNYNKLIIPKFINEYWTAKQRQCNAIHEVSYRACFKPQLPNFFIRLLTTEGDIIFDPFSGRGTTAIEAALINRRFIANDINPLSVILTKPRIKPPTLTDIEKRMFNIDFSKKNESDMDLSMFYHPNTLNELLCLKNYLNNYENDDIDDWIRMVATNRLTGHSKGFFSVYTLPPNQAVSPESQKKINAKKNQLPDYRNVKELIIGKSKALLKEIDDKKRKQLFKIAENSSFYTLDAGNLPKISDETINLTVTSPPFLNIIQYANDNWLRCWFNGLDLEKISKNIVMAKTTAEWSEFIHRVFKELYRITKKDGYVAFEVGEVNNGKVNLEEYVTDIGIKLGFECIGIIINAQTFTKTSNIWGINNNDRGTNTNRIVLFKK